MQLKNKTVLMTGAQGGIGKPLRQLLEKNGATVIAIGRNEDGRTKQVDLTNTQQLNDFCSELSEKKIDILINLAGLMYFGDLCQQQTNNVENMIAVNLTAPIKLAQAVIPSMLIEQNGHIVNVGSIFGSLPFPSFSVYSSTKAALKGFSESMRREYAHRGIKVTHVAPRSVDTPFNGSAVERFNSKIKANVDSPQKVANIIYSSIINNKKTVNVGFSESLFVKINALAPSIIDKALLSKQLIAQHILSGESA